MPPPLPLTAAPIPELDWSRTDTPVAADFGDIYFSTDGGIEETHAVFLKGCELPERWQDSQDHIIGELGFGSGLNLLAAWDEFEKHAKDGQFLHFISVEKFPFTADMLRQALSHWPALKDKAARLIDLWPGPVKGLHRLHLSPHVTLTLYIEDVETALDQMQTPIDSWFLDGFSPAKNPAMWTPQIMQKLARLSHSQTRLATFTVAGHVRQALSEAGFTVSKAEGFGRKRHRLEARFESGPERPVTAITTPFIIGPIRIGGGIAGASLIKAAGRAGLTPRLIHDDPDMQRAASGNAAALIKPRLDLQDRPESRFFLSAYLHALRAYEDEGEVISRGITQIAKDAKEQERFTKFTANAPLPPAHLTAAAKGLDFPSALVIDPVKTINKWRQGCGTHIAKASKIDRHGDQWQAFDEDGQIIGQSELMIIASGAGVREIKLGGKGTLAEILALRFSRGQLSWAKGRIDGPTAYGGYALTIGGDILIGATHDRLGGNDPYAARSEDDVKNLAGAQNFLNGALKLSGKTGRASIRVTTADTLPRLIEIETGLWVMTGLGSRGFVFAPLLADHLIAHLTGQPAAITPQALGKFSQG